MKLSTWGQAAFGRRRWFGWSAAVIAAVWAWWALSTRASSPPPEPDRAPVVARLSPPDSLRSSAARPEPPRNEPAQPLDWNRVRLPRTQEDRAVASTLAQALELKLGAGITECMEGRKPPSADRGVEGRAEQVQLELRLRARGDAVSVEDTVFLGGDAADELVQTCLREVFDGVSLRVPKVRGDRAYRLPFTIWN